MRCHNFPYALHLANKTSINIKYFSEWKDSIFKVIKGKIDSIKFAPKRSTSLFRSEKETMDTLKSHFVMTGVDKANNNPSFICKKYYLENIHNELKNTSTYEHTTKSIDEITQSHVMFCSKFNIPVDDHILPFLHMLPKFHKSPVDFRYIAAGAKSTIKPLSKILSSSLKLITSHLKRMTNYKFKFLNTSGFWIVNNKDTTLNNLNFLNNTTNAKSIKSFDFKKLYTNLPHNLVIEKLCNLIDMAFNDKQCKFINVNTKYISSWSNKSSAKWSFTKDDLKEMLTFMMDNIYVTFGDTIFKQLIGIPMGCDCAPNVADLFLFSYELEFVTIGVENKAPIVHKLKFNGRYLDDLNCPNADCEVANAIVHDIYPRELVIVDTNPNVVSTCTFLDLEIFIRDNKFCTRLYDKRRDFPFSVISLPNLKSNVPCKQSLGVFIGELYRICKSSSDIDDFVLEVKALLVKLVRQNFNRNDLISTLKKFISSRPACLHKYWSNIQTSMFI